MELLEGANELIDGSLGFDSFIDVDLDSLEEGFVNTDGPLGVKETESLGVKEGFNELIDGLMGIDGFKDGNLGVLEEYFVGTD